MRVSSVGREWGDFVDQAGAAAAAPACRKGERAWRIGDEGMERATDAERAGAQRRPGKTWGRRGVWMCAGGRAEGADAVMLPVKVTWLSPACYAACAVFF
ncbi:hypothetical protein KYC_28222 [Achromobacter arsenitoxydans SY8]|uniref:Uncharacterized protein n=1 Tax=Achromobacter arsenitoxydans SY8 TaxID=477184 RepID=H0FFS4_9BURK|nr:hypothetical protein KYC_28222 [Achromobacter arsenitoxydans SY8]